MYRNWQTALPANVEMICVQPPGRETRIFEQPYTCIHSLIEVMAPVLAEYTDKRFAFFGHSMGALIGFELCRHLRKQSRMGPACLIVSGCAAPHVPNENPLMHNLPDGEFMQKLREYNGTTTAVLDNSELMELCLPGLRADFELCESYTYRDDVALDVPIMAIGGLKDPDVSVQDINDWREHTTGRFRAAMLPGDHFFIDSARPVILQLLSQHLAGL